MTFSRSQTAFSSFIPVQYIRRKSGLATRDYFLHMLGVNKSRMSGLFRARPYCLQYKRLLSEGALILQAITLCAEEGLIPHSSPDKCFRVEPIRENLHLGKITLYGSKQNFVISLRGWLVLIEDEIVCSHHKIYKIHPMKLPYMVWYYKCKIITYKNIYVQKVSKCKQWG